MSCRKIYTYIFVFAVFLQFTFNVSAQEATKVEIKKSTQTELINGVRYYVHKVDKGHTLYSICKLYEVTSSEITTLNPEIKEGLKLNQLLKIPMHQPKAATGVISKERSTVTSTRNHLVEKQQTLYSIAKKYDLSQEEIKAANGGLVDGIKEGQNLIIPASKDALNASTVAPAKSTEHAIKKEVSTIQKAEIKPVSPVAPLTISRPVKPTEIKPEQKTFDGKYRVGLFLPLYLAAADTFKVEKSEPETIFPRSVAAVEFYQGFMSALDSVKHDSLNLKLYVYDTPIDSSQLIAFLKKPELKDLHLMVGPFHSNSVAEVAEFANTNRIPMVAPFSQVTKALLGNPYLSKTTPSSSTQISKIASYIGANCSNKQVLLIYNNQPKEKNLTEIFKNKLEESRKDTIYEHIYNSDEIKKISSKLSKEKVNIIVIPSTDQAAVTDIINKIGNLKETYKFEIYGMESWFGYDNLDIENLETLQTRLPSNTFVNYSDTLTLEFIRSFRKTFGSEPGKFAFAGYDIGRYYLQALLKYNTALQDNIENLKYKGLQQNIDFYKTAPESGFENQHVNLLEYKAYTLSKLP